ncbi:conserved hypothetical protein [Ricinus communis]|uniref:Uncharacterized protein n=1 Tax=Ricinus communis TaxID=3988 RepID=B9RVZ1_RICCO|nr:conserved hypothetical protein [Ricinus communis]|eukprot:XP_002517910.1 uncharacterized protein LOC8262058 isoform X1 [Ricinus communis]
MVVPLGPGKFYGSSLPRPRIYTDVKFNSDRVDPPVPVTDPFLSWAQEAHWSMGGHSFQRLRLQGRIEGSVNKLRKFREKEAKLQARNSPASNKKNDNGKRVGSASPPPAPKVIKRRRFMDLMDEESEEEEEEEIVEKVKKKKSVRKLVGDFEKVATESVENKGKASGGIDDAVMKVVEEVNRENSVGKKLRRGKKGKSNKENGSSPVNGVRTSPRLAKQRSSH